MPGVRFTIENLGSPFRRLISQVELSLATRGADSADTTRERFRNPFPRREPPEPERVKKEAEKERDN